MSDHPIIPDIEQLLQLKLMVPRLPANLVNRPRLIEILDSVPDHSFIKFIAPAGFGKTTLLAQWCAHLSARGEKVAWLSLDDSDADLYRFLTGIVRALEVAQIDTGILLSKIDRDASELSINNLLRDLYKVLAGVREPVTLILDDYHRASNNHLDELLEHLRSHLSAQVRILLSTRLRAENTHRHKFIASTLVEITSDMLRFTPVEARQVLNIDICDTDRDVLVERIEGYPVVLQLARLVAFQGQSSPDVLERLMARGGHLWSFLTEEVLRNLPEEVVDFLLDTSIFDRFTVEIADVVRQRKDSWQIMSQLETLQSLLTPLDSNNHWYRYHHLFAEYLQAQLRQRHPAKLAALHLRASEAFQQYNILGEAVRHASLAGDYGLCTQLIESAGGWRLVLYGGMSQLNQLLNYIPKAERLSHPRLLLAEAYLMLKSGNMTDARTTFNLVAQSMPDFPPDWDLLDEWGRDFFSVDVLIRTYEDNSVNANYLAFFEKIKDWPPETDGLAYGVLGCAGAVYALCLGRLNAAEEFARKAMTAMRFDNSVLGLNYCFIHAAIACTYRGELRSAAAYLLRAQAMAIENFGEDSGLKAIIDVLLVMVNQWGNNDLAIVSAEYDASFQQVCEYDGWFDIYAAGLDARFWIAWKSRDIRKLDQVIRDGANLTRSRGLDRLSGLVEAQTLLRHCLVQDEKSAFAVAQHLGQIYPLGCWRENAAKWRPYQDVGYALISWLLTHNIQQAKLRADDLLSCAKNYGAGLYQIRALLLRARVAQALKDRDKACGLIGQAVELAAAEKIIRPFLEQYELAQCFTQLKRELWETGRHPVEASFLSDVTDILSKFYPDTQQTLLVLSAREQEVMQELSRGLTNKEIARVLDMTEHTVKFHLKNIFAKLNVDRRAHAIEIYRKTEASTL